MDAGQEGAGSIATKPIGLGHRAGAHVFRLLGCSGSHAFSGIGGHVGLRPSIPVAHALQGLRCPLLSRHAPSQPCRVCLGSPDSPSCSFRGTSLLNCLCCATAWPQGHCLDARTCASPGRVQGHGPRARCTQSLPWGSRGLGSRSPKGHASRAAVYGPCSAKCRRMAAMWAVARCSLPSPEPPSLLTPAGCGGGPACIQARAPMPRVTRAPPSRPRQASPPSQPRRTHRQAGRRRSPADRPGRP